MPDNKSLGSVDVALSPWERFEEYLKSKGKRVTQQRQNLLKLVFEYHEHFDTDELLQRLSREKKEKKIGRATVYRTLNEMVDAGLLRRMEIAGRSVYEHDYGYPQHDHLHCTVCDALIEFSNEDLVALRDAVAATHRFRATGHRFIISGTCYDCRTKRHRQQSRHDWI